MGQYFDEQPQASSNIRTIELLLPDVSFELKTDRGVFSAERVDVGSKYLLLEGPSAVSGDQNLLDIGCGYGPITCALAARNPQSTVWAVDVNRRARDLCQQNADLNELHNVNVVAPQDLPAETSFDRIWSNPPIRIGKSALHELLLRWLSQLAAQGSAHLVVQKHLGADSLHRWLQSQGYSVSRRGSRKAFRLLDIQQNSIETNQ